MRIPLLLAATLLCLPTLRAQETNLPPTVEERYLFLVDMSSSMRKIAHESRQAIFDLVYWGIDGHMMKGDTYGLWTFNADAYPGRFPMQVWDPELLLPLASQASLFLRDQPYENKAKLSKVMIKLLSIVMNVKDVNVFIVTDGDSPMVGLPFDDAINAAFEEREKERKRAKKPFVLSLVARGGDITAWSVTVAGETFTLPARKPRPIEPAKPEPAPAPETAKTRLAPGIRNDSGVLLAPEEKEKPVFKGKVISMRVLDPDEPAGYPANPSRTAPSSLAMSGSATAGAVPKAASVATPSTTPQTVSKPFAPDTTPAPVTRAPAPTVPTASTVPSAPAAAVVTAVPTVAPVPTASSPQAASASAGSQPVYAPQTATASTPARRPAPARVVSAREPAAGVDRSSVAMTTSATVSPPPIMSAWELFIAGGILLLTAIGLVFAFIRRLHPVPEPSYITQSMESRS